MGTQFSSLEQSNNNPFIQQFISDQAISVNDPFWNQFVSFQFEGHLSEKDVKHLEDLFEKSCVELLKNAGKSKNFISLSKFIAKRIGQLLEDSTLASRHLFCWQLYNALFIYRIVAKYLVDYVLDDDIIAGILNGDDTVVRDASSTPKSPTSTNNNLSNTPVVGLSISLEEVSGFAELLRSLFDFLLNISVSPFTYPLHVEILNILVVLLSYQMSFLKPVREFKTFEILMNDSSMVASSEELVCLMLRHIASQETYNVLNKSGWGFSTVLYGLFNVLTLGVGPKIVSSASGATDVKPVPLLAQQSLTVLLLLIYQGQADADRLPEQFGAGEPGNTYRRALMQCHDSSVADVSNHPPPSTSSTTPSRSSSQDVPSARCSVDFARLYKEICDRLTVDRRYILLLYILLNKNASFRAFVFSRSDLDGLIIPLLTALDAVNRADIENVNHIYMNLVVLLMLTEDSCLCTAVNSILVRDLSWLRDSAGAKNMTNLSLCSVMVLVLGRAVQLTVSKNKDRYLYTNCLAALANLSSHFSGLNPQVCSRLLGLIKLLLKRYEKLIQKCNPSADPTGLSRQSTSLSAASVDTTTSVEHCNIPIDDQSLLEDFQITEEVLRMLLEVLNNCVTQNPRRNAPLIYAMLYEKKMFQTCSSVHGAVFGEVIQNSLVVLHYLEQRLQDKKATTMANAEEVTLYVQEELMKFPCDDRLKRQPELKFRYVEQPNSEEFFLPYLWSLVVMQSQLAFRKERLKLVKLLQTS